MRRYVTIEVHRLRVTLAAFEGAALMLGFIGLVWAVAATLGLHF